MNINTNGVRRRPKSKSMRVRERKRKKQRADSSNLRFWRPRVQMS